MAEVLRSAVDAFVHDLYAAAIGDVAWPDALGGLTGLVPCEFATLEIMDAKSGAYIDFHSSRSLEINADYLGYYCKLNPRLDGVLNRPELFLMGDYDFMSEAEMERDEFYSDFLRPHGLRYCAGVRTLHTPDLIGTFSLQRSPRQGHVTENELNTLNHLRRHMRRATLAYLRFGHLAAENKLFSSLLARLEDGVIVIGPNGKVRFMNEAAAGICHDDDGIGYRGGVLKIQASRADRLLRQAAAEAQGAKLPEPPEDCRVIVPRRSGLPPYVITIVPVPSDQERRFDMWRGGLILLVNDPARPGRPAHEILKAAYGLSPAEADVACAIAGGLTVRQIADNRGVSIATVRSQMQSALQKTHLRRQADLVRLVLKLL